MCEGCLVLGFIHIFFFFFKQANSRKRKPRNKKSKTLKPSKIDEGAKSPSSDLPSDKKSDVDEDDIKEEMVLLESSNPFSNSAE